MYEGPMEKVCTSSLVGHLDRNPTVGENLEFRIAALKVELKRLEDSREALKPLLDMRIRDIRDAMSF